jgi:hypothetical protein
MGRSPDPGGEGPGGARSGERSEPGRAEPGTSPPRERDSLGRRSFTAEQRAAILAELERSGESVSEFARKRGLSTAFRNSGDVFCRSPSARRSWYPRGREGKEWLGEARSGSSSRSRTAEPWRRWRAATRCRTAT